MEKGISVIIPSWNGKHLLEQYLPSVIESMNEVDTQYEIIIVDDASTDDSVSFINKRYPEIRVVQNKNNSGFSISCNNGIKEAQYQWVLLLNNDVKLTPNYVKLLFKKTNIKDLFSVGGSIREIESGNMIDGGKLGKFIGGNFRVTDNYFVTTANPDELYYTFYNPATCCLYNREKLVALEGFDELFNPFNWEDADIAYRAWKRGWISLYEPGAIAFHTPNTTIGKTYDNEKIYIISKRNKFFFHWKNLSDKSFILTNFLSLILNITVRWLLLDFKYYLAFKLALIEFKNIYRKRKIELKHRKLTDKAVLKYIASTILKSEIKFVK